VGRRGVVVVGTLVAAVAAVFGACYACSSPGEPPAAVADAGEAETSPSSNDGRTRDAPTTADVIDGGVFGCDAAAGESDALPSALWEKIPGLDPCCSDRIARDPDKVIPPIKWEACTSGMCERAVGSTKPGTGGAYRLYNEPLRYSDGVHYFTYVLQEELPAGLVRILPVMETFGPFPKRLIVTAWDARAGARCGVAPYFGPGGSILTSMAFASRAGYLGLLPAGRYSAADIQVLTLPTYSGAPADGAVPVDDELAGARWRLEGEQTGREVQRNTYVGACRNAEERGLLAHGWGRWAYACALAT
jgi:hypothetical protein